MYRCCENTELELIENDERVQDDRSFSGKRVLRCRNCSSTHTQKREAGRITNERTTDFDPKRLPQADR
jgi:hypothetical protein